MAEFISKEDFIGGEKDPEKIKYWEVQNIPNFLVRELRRRKVSNNIGQEYTEYNPNVNTYKGQMSPWIRLFSNGTGLPKNTRVPTSEFLKKGGEFKRYEGFVLDGGKSFDSAFGLRNGNENQSILTQDSQAIIGYQANNDPHYIDTRYRNLDNFNTNIDKDFPQNNTSPVFLPPPGIVSANIQTTGEMMSFADIKFKCYSIAQVEYLAPFFLTPGVNLFLEFGWNLFNKESLLDLTNVTTLFDIYKHPVKAIERFDKSNGNYGLAMGPITNYNFNTKDGREYDCTVKITDRQALFQGFRIDTNSTKKEKQTENDSVNFTDKNKINFKDLVRIYLPFLDECISAKKNFQSYIKRITNISDESKTYNYQPVVSAGTGAPNLVVSAGTGAPAGSFTEKNRLQENDSEQFFDLKPENSGLKPEVKEKFFGGKPETRVFFGRNKRLLDDKNFSYEKDVKDTILSYGVVNEVKIQGDRPSLNSKGSVLKPAKVPSTTLYSDIDSKDFDRSDKLDDMWMKIDFLFEFLNENTTDEFQINYDILVNAHPNLISCDKNILIPNAIAPKINRGTIASLAGYLSNSENENKFFTQPFTDVSKINKEDPLYKSYKKCREVFRTGISNGPRSEKESKGLGESKLNEKGQRIRPEYSYNGSTIGKYEFERQNLDQIINSYFYKNLENPEEEKYNSEFPQKKLLVRDIKKYEPYMYGRLKDLYISRKVVMDVVKDPEVKTLQQFLERILKIINESVNNYWLFDIVNDAQGGLTIIDKSLNNMTEIYTFELSSGNNVIKEINFDVSLSSENSTQILFSDGNNKLETLITSDNTEKTFDLMLLNKSLPKVSFSDRFDLDVDRLKDVSNTISASTVDVSDFGNKEITSLQTYGSHNNILNMTFAIDTPSTGVANIYYNLNLPPSMKPQLSAMLNDEDYKRNTTMYSNVADNFVIDLKLQGMFGFRMFQHFAINNLPKPYVQGNCIFMVHEISHTLSNGVWETNIKALLKGTHPDRISKYYLI